MKQNYLNVCVCPKKMICIYIKNFLFIMIYLILILLMCMCVFFPCVCGCPQRPEEGIGPFELELKALDVGAGN